MYNVNIIWMAKVIQIVQALSSTWYGNSGSSSNRPYMVLVNTHDPAWKMNHSSGYVLDIEVAIGIWR